MEEELANEFKDFLDGATEDISWEVRCIIEKWDAVFLVLLTANINGVEYKRQLSTGCLYLEDCDWATDKTSMAEAAHGMAMAAARLLKEEAHDGRD